MKYIYIAGPMKGIKDHNLPEFEKVEKLLRDKGFNPINPGKIPGHDKINKNNELSDDEKWVEHLKLDIPELLKCNSIILLEGWEKSKGAMLELTIANSLNMRVIELIIPKYN